MHTYKIYLICKYILLKTFQMNQSSFFLHTATGLPSRKLSKLDEPDMQDTAGEAGTSA